MNSRPAKTNENPDVKKTKSKTKATRPDPNPPSASSKVSSPEFKSILVPLDFSSGSSELLAYAATFARKVQAKLTLLHVVEPVATPDFAKSFPLAMESDERLAGRKRQLERLANDQGIQPDLVERILVRFGRGYNEIAGAAHTLKSDLIIISTHGFTGLKHALLGSTTERVVRHAPCAVLVLRTNLK